MKKFLALLLAVVTVFSALSGLTLAADTAPVVGSVALREVTG